MTPGRANGLHVGAVGDGISYITIVRVGSIGRGISRGPSADAARLHLSDRGRRNNFDLLE